MSGTSEGGRKAAARNKLLYGEDFYKVLGKKGGLVKPSKPSGFGADRSRAKMAGRIGGLISKRNRYGN